MNSASHHSSQLIAILATFVMMKYTTFLFVNAAASVLANLDSRQEAGKPAVDCGGEIYDEVEDSNAWIRGCWESTFPPEEPLEFPIEFENKENFNFTEAYPLYEFPLIHGEEPWSGGTCVSSYDVSAIY